MSQTVYLWNITNIDLNKLRPSDITDQVKTINDEFVSGDYSGKKVAGQFYPDEPVKKLKEPGDCYFKISISSPNNNGEVNFTVDPQDGSVNLPSGTKLQVTGFAALSDNGAVKKFDIDSHGNKKESAPVSKPREIEPSEAPKGYDPTTFHKSVSAKQRTDEPKPAFPDKNPHFSQGYN